MTCSHNADIGTAERRIVGSATVVNLILLQFLSGFAWAVQRPQGFVVILFERAGFSGPAIGLISAVGLVAPIFTGPLIGFLADRTAAHKRHYVFTSTSLLKACCQCAVWPALRLAPARWSFGWVLALMCMQAACSPGGLLTEITLRYVGTETYGKVRLWGGVGFATGSLLTGLLVQWLNASIGYDVIFLESLAVGLAMSGIAVGLSRTCSREQLLSTSSEMVSAQGGQDVNESVAQALHSRPRLRELMRFVTLPRVAVTLAIVVALGFGEGIMQTYTYVRLQHLKHGSSTIMGLSAVCMIISEIPFFYFAKNIIDRFGIMPIMSLALCCTALRQAWIAWLWDAAWVLPGELLHGITFSIANAAVTLDVHDIAPEHLQATMQSLVGSCWVGVGQGSAAWVGGLLLHCLGEVALFKISAATALASSLLPAVVACTSLAKPPAATAAPSTTTTSP